MQQLKTTHFTEHTNDARENQTINNITIITM